MLNIINGILQEINHEDPHITELVIPDGVTEIADHALWNLHDLQRVVIPETVTRIGESAFMWLKQLKSVTIPHSVKSIGRSAFYGCENLEEVIIENGVDEIPQSTFFECKNLKEINIPPSVKSIGEGAFRDCYALEKVTFSEGLEEIGASAFLWCTQLEKIHIPASVKDIGNATFSACKRLTEFTVDEQNPYFTTIDNVLYDKNCTKILYCPYSKTTLQLPETLQEIGSFAFAWCVHLKELEIPDSVTLIGGSAFRRTNALSEVTISEKVQFPRSPEFADTTCIHMQGKDGIFSFYPTEGDHEASYLVLYHDYSWQMNHEAKYTLIWRMYFAGISGADAYVKKNFAKMFRMLIDKEDIPTIQKVLDKQEMLTTRNIKRFLEYAENQPEILKMLMDYQENCLKKK